MLVGQENLLTRRNYLKTRAAVSSQLKYPGIGPPLQAIAETIGSDMVRQRNGRDDRTLSLVKINANVGANMGRRHQSIVETIGRTPVVRINRLAPKAVNLFVKVEAFNPLGSVKDRLALGVIEAAELSGELKPGQTVIEATSGNKRMRNGLLPRR